MQLADHYKEQFHALATRWQDGYLQQRRQALNTLLEQGFPGRTREEWRFTDVSSIAACPYEPAALGTPATQQAESTAAAAQAPQHHTLRFVNGAPVARAPESLLQEGVILNSHEGSPQSLPKVVQTDFFAAEADDGLLLMNAAFVGGGACLYVPPGCKLTAPVYLDLVFTRETSPKAYNLRHVLVLGEGAEAEVLEHYHYTEHHADHGEHADLCNVISCVALAPGAKLRHSQMIACGRNAHAFTSVQVTQQADSHYRAHALGREAVLGRQEYRVALCGAGADVELDCLHGLDGDNHLELRTLVEHAAPRTSSLQLYRGMMAERAHGVFNGKVRVNANAEHTEARQDSAALLLDDGAQADACPMLEIYTDAVKCSHGATVGRMEEDALFYLQARALGRQEAEELLRLAFAQAVLERLPEATRDLLAAMDPQWAGDLLQHMEIS